MSFEKEVEGLKKLIRTNRFYNTTKANKAFFDWMIDNFSTSKVDRNITVRQAQFAVSFLIKQECHANALKVSKFGGDMLPVVSGWLTYGDKSYIYHSWNKDMLRNVELDFTEIVNGFHGETNSISEDRISHFIYSEKTYPKEVRKEAGISCMSNIPMIKFEKDYKKKLSKPLKEASLNRLLTF